jgi:hypothetical protein
MSNEKYFPKQFVQLFRMEKVEGDMIIWKQTDPFTFTCSMCLYYQGGQWRHVTVRYDLRNAEIDVSSVLYMNGSEEPEGNEIIRSEWDNLGYEIKNTKGDAVSEIILPNCSMAMEWLERKGLILKVPLSEWKKLRIQLARFIGSIRLAMQEQDKSQSTQDLLNSEIENVGINSNANLIRKYLERIPNNKIWNDELSEYSNLYSVSSVKSEQQINPKHIKQLKQLFFGEINANSF